MALLEIRDLRVTFATEEGPLTAVDGISLDLEQGRTLGIVGESGSGKTVTVLTLVGLTRSKTTEITGSVLLDGVDLLRLSVAELRSIRGERIGMIFQDPLSSLHPHYRVGWQIAEAVRAHQRVSKRAARSRAIELLQSVRIPDPSARVNAYPHELSGGMRQRVMIAMAIALDPDVLLADEPTTALDVTVQAQILELLAELRRERGMAVVLVTHDLGIVSETADDVAVMYAGRIVERGSRAAVLGAPTHPYTQGLLTSIPSMDGDRLERFSSIPGSPPRLTNVPSGCSFHPRCSLAEHRCSTQTPELDEIVPGHRAACLLAGEARARGTQIARTTS